MKWFMITGAALLLVIVIGAFQPLVQRLVKSAWLILQVSPYEQVGTGAGTIFVVGDSTAYGTGASRAEASVAGQLGAAFPQFAVETNAKNGRLIAEVTPVLMARDATSPVNLLLLQIGGNDILAGRSIEVMEADIRQVLTLAQTRAAHVVFMSTGNVGAASFFTTNGMPDPELEARTRAARAMYLEVTAELGVSYVDLFTEPAFDQFLKEPEVYLAWDGLHPSDAGYALWYESLAPVVAPYLE